MLMPIDLFFYAWQEELPVTVAQMTKQVLSANDIERLQRFSNRPAQERFLAARWLVKTELARRLNQAPASIEFDFQSNGKPCLSGSGWHFSIAHCKESVLVAIANHPVGCDLEPIERFQSVRFLSQLEWNPAMKTMLETSDRPEFRCRRIARYWTALEASLKLQGGHLLQQMARFSLPITAPFDWDSDADLFFQHGKDFFASLLHANLWMLSVSSLQPIERLNLFVLDENGAVTSERRVQAG